MTASSNFLSPASRNFRQFEFMFELRGGIIEDSILAFSFLDKDLELVILNFSAVYNPMTSESGISIWGFNRKILTVFDRFKPEHFRPIVLLLNLLVKLLNFRNDCLLSAFYDPISFVKVNKCLSKSGKVLRWATERWIHTDGFCVKTSSYLKYGSFKK